MYYSSEIINYLQANKILTLKLDHVLAGVGKVVSTQIKSIGGRCNACAVLYVLLYR